MLVSVERYPKFDPVSEGLQRLLSNSGPLCRSGPTGSKMSKFAQGLSKLKLKEVPTYVKEHAGG